MRRILLLGLVAWWSGWLGSSAANATIDLASGSLTHSIVHAHVNDLATGAVISESSFVDDFFLTAPPEYRSFEKRAVALAQSHIQISDLSSSIATFELEGNPHVPFLLARGNGNSLAHFPDDAAGWYSGTSSSYVTNLKFYTSTSLYVDWQYQANGMPGNSGVTDGLDLRLAIRQYSDATYSGDAVVVTNQFFGAGSSQQQFVLPPGYYNLVTQGRSLFNQLNEFNRDGDANWWYEYTIHVVPEPAGLWLAALATAAVGSFRRLRLM